MILYYYLMTKVDRSYAIVRYFPRRVVTGKRKAATAAEIFGERGKEIVLAQGDKMRETGIALIWSSWWI
jgi:hypothetical protein